jgi:hypothetical protein
MLLVGLPRVSRFVFDTTLSEQFHLPEDPAAEMRSLKEGTGCLPTGLDNGSLCLLWVRPRVGRYEDNIKQAQNNAPLRYGRAD